MRFFFAVLLCLISGVQSCLAEKIRIGVSLPLSGDAAAYGSDFQKIYQFANEKLAGNAYELLFEDDQCDPRVAVTVANKFTAIDKLMYILGATCDGVFSSAGPIYRRADTLVISTSAAVVEGERLFHTVPAIRAWPETLLNFLKGRHEVVSLISEETGFAQDFSAGFIPLAPHFNLRVSSESFRSSDSDFRSILARLNNAAPDAFIFLTQTDASLIRLVDQYRSLKLKAPIYNVFFAATPTFLKSAGKNAEGIRVLDLPDLDASLTETGRGIYAEYLHRFGNLGSGKAMFVSVFEAFRAMHLAIQSKQDAAEYLRSARFFGLSGPWHFDSDGFWVGQNLIMKIIRDGTPVPFKD